MFQGKEKVTKIQMKNNQIMEKKFGILEIEKIMRMADSKTNIPVIDDILADDKFVKIPLKELYSINELEYDNKALELSLIHI